MGGDTGLLAGQGPAFSEAHRFPPKRLPLRSEHRDGSRFAAPGARPCPCQADGHRLAWHWGTRAASPQVAQRGLPQGPLGARLIIRWCSLCVSLPLIVLSSPKYIYLKSCDQKVKEKKKNPHKIKQDIKMKKIFARRLKVKIIFISKVCKRQPRFSTRTSPIERLLPAGRWEGSWLARPGFRRLLLQAGKFILIKTNGFFLIIF